MEEIDLNELFIFVKNKIGLLLTIIIAVCLLGCMYGLFIQVPMYQSYTTVILGGSDNASTGITTTEISLNKNLVDTYAQIVKSRRVLDQVIKKLSLDVTYDNLEKQVSVSALNNTEIIKITVSDKDGVNAENIANVIAEVFSKEVANLYNLNNVSILDEAIVAENPYNVNIIKQLVIYIMVGLVLACGILFVIFYFDRTIKTVEQVEQKIKLPILGQVEQYTGGVKKK